MSLFENGRYQWRETYLILFESELRPTGEEIQAVLSGLSAQYQILDVRIDEEGRFDSLTLISPDDYAAMDVSYVSGEEVTEQTDELVKDLELTVSSPAEEERLVRLTALDARFDVYHFEELVSGNEEDDEFMDPGCLLQVMERLTQLVGGIGVDPAAGSLL